MPGEARERTTQRLDTHRAEDIGTFLLPNTATPPLGDHDRRHDDRHLVGDRRGKDLSHRVTTALEAYQCAGVEREARHRALRRGGLRRRFQTASNSA